MVDQLREPSGVWPLIPGAFRSEANGGREALVGQPPGKGADCQGGLHVGPALPLPSLAQLPVVRAQGGPGTSHAAQQATGPRPCRIARVTSRAWGALPVWGAGAAGRGDGGR